jgi:hypothetical protein
LIVFFLSDDKLQKGGKSAILDAVILGLGGKVTHTGRQANFKSFIKTGCE